MDAKDSHGNSSETQRNSEVDQKINQITFQQIEIYLQNLVSFILLSMASAFPRLCSSTPARQGRTTSAGTMKIFLK